MKANEFVKKFGWDEARKQLKKPTGIYGEVFDYQFMGDLKRLVESWELVDSIGGLQFAKNFIKQAGSTMDNMLERAIVDVESCL